MNIICYDAIMEQNKSFGENLSTIRKKKGYTQAQLADLTGISRRAIVHYENHVKQPVVEKVKKLADALNVTIDELFESSNQKKKKNTEDISYKIMKKVRLIEKLPTRDQNTIFSLINSLIEKNKLKGKL